MVKRKTVEEKRRYAREIASIITILKRLLGYESRNAFPKRP
jgi:hypothetical protein